MVSIDLELDVAYEPTQDMAARIFAHGPGGSGKTFTLKEVILPVYNELLYRRRPRGRCPKLAARLRGGSTFHHMAGLTQAQKLLLQKPSKTKKEALQRKWWRLSQAFVDEIREDGRPKQRRKKVDIDEHGLAVFRAFVKQVILFRGSHRFRKGDPLAELLETMRVVGVDPCLQL